MYKLIIIIILFLLFFATCCMAFRQPRHLKGPDIQHKYYDQIREWQERVKSEGWTDGLIKEIVDTCIDYVIYTPEPYKEDHWQTPSEMIQNGFKGDCEDIAVLIWGTFWRLGYQDVRILLVHTLIPGKGHALIRVKMTDGSWKIFQTVPMPGDWLDALFYRPQIEFNKDEIWIFKN